MQVCHVWYKLPHLRHATGYPAQREARNKECDSPSSRSLLPLRRRSVAALLHCLHGALLALLAKLWRPGENLVRQHRALIAQDILDRVLLAVPETAEGKSL